MPDHQSTAPTPSQSTAAPTASLGSPGAKRGPDRRRRWRLRRLAGLVVVPFLGLLAAVIITAAIGAGTGWWHFEVIESGSMTPALRVGGVAVVQPEPVGAVRVGQVIALHPPNQPGIVRVHRVIEVTHRGNQVWVRTKGDANPSPDPGPLRLVGPRAYVVRFFIPYVGYGGVWLYKAITRRVLEAVFFVLVVGGALVLIWGKGDEERAREAKGKHAQADGQPPPRPAGPIGSTSHALRRPPTASPAAAVATQAATATLAALGQAYAAASEARDETGDKAVEPQGRGTPVGTATP